MKNVLITAIGSFAADIVIKKLKKSNYNVIGCNVYPKEWTEESLEVDSFYQVPFANNNKYIYEILKICEFEKINYIIPLTDVEVDCFNSNRKLFEKKNITICISNEKTIDLCRNKKKLEEFLKIKNIIKTIDTYYLTPDIKVDFPAVCKPYDGRSSQGLKIIKNSEEYDFFVKNNDINKYIVQPYIKGDVITVDIVRQKNGKNIITIPRKELLRTINGAGTSVYIFKDKKLSEKCVEIANALKVEGCVNFEFILDENNTYYFMECNPRFSGGVEFSCMTGYDCVINHMKCFENKEIDTLKQYNNQYIVRKYEEYITKIENDGDNND